MLKDSLNTILFTSKEEIQALVEENTQTAHIRKLENCRTRMRLPLQLRFGFIGKEEYEKVLKALKFFFEEVPR